MLALFETLIERYGEGALLVAAGLVVGVVFGASAQHSRFCLRAATAEFSSRQLGPRTAIWLVAFFAALTLTQGLVAFGILDVSQARQLAATGSLSGAIIGGTFFGIGMVLARGCVSRLLVLSATGNLRAIVTGLVLTLVAQASLSGVLAPLREKLGSLWVVSGGEARDLLHITGLGQGTVTVLAVILLGISIGIAFYRRCGLSRLVAAALVGGAVALGWALTYDISLSSFDVVPVSSVTFTGPSADTLMGLVNNRSMPGSFSIGLVPGVFLGAAVMAILSGEFRLQRFGPDTPMERYLVGAVFMGFGSMLAGGCAVGAGLSGGAIMALTAWIAVFFMWIGAVSTTLIMQAVAPQAVTGAASAA